MKYVLMLAGALVFLAGAQVAVNGAQEGWDAGVASIIVLVGLISYGGGLAIWVYDRYWLEE